MRWFDAGLMAVRRRIQRREPRGHVVPAFDPEVFRSRFLALRRADRLAEAEVERLEALFAAHAELGRALAMLQELHGLYLAEDDAAAMDSLDRFSRLYVDDPLPDFYKVIDTLLHWSPEIFAFHKGREGPGLWSMPMRKVRRSGIGRREPDGPHEGSAVDRLRLAVDHCQHGEPGPARVRDVRRERSLARDPKAALDGHGLGGEAEGHDLIGTAGVDLVHLLGREPLAGASGLRVPRLVSRAM
ncbi:MAG: transposase [Acidimicrobiales bacterium]